MIRTINKELLARFQNTFAHSNLKLFMHTISINVWSTICNKAAQTPRVINTLVPRRPK